MPAAAEELYHLLLECVTDHAILLLDPDGRVASWNVGAERILGYQEAEVLGRPLAIFFTPEDRDAGFPAKELDGARATGRAADDRWHIRKDGSRFWCSGMLTAVRDGRSLPSPGAGRFTPGAASAAALSLRAQALTPGARLVADEPAWPLHTDGRRWMLGPYRMEDRDLLGATVDYYQPIYQVDPYPEAAAIQTILDEEEHPAASTTRPQDVVDYRFAERVRASGFLDSLAK